MTTTTSTVEPDAAIQRRAGRPASAGRLTEDVDHAVALFARLMRLSLRDPAFAYVFPAVGVLSFVAILSQVYGSLASLAGYPTPDLIDWMGPGMIFMAGTMGAGFSASVLVTDANNGFLDRLRILPARRRSILVGALAFEAVRTLPIALSVIAASVAFGMPVPGAGPTMLVLALSSIWTMAWNAMFIAATLATRSPEMPQTLLPMFLPLFFTSSIIVPRANMPDYIERLSRVNPMDVLVDATRPGLIEAQTLDWSDVLVATGVAVGLFLLLRGFAGAALRRMTARS